MPVPSRLLCLLPWMVFLLGADIPRIEGGGFHTAAVLDDGTLWTWGANWNGQLGRGGDPLLGTQIGTGTDWIDVDAGNDHTLALERNGTVWAFGYNRYGPLGVGDELDRATPTQVGISDVVAISTGYEHSLALDDSGVMWAWGKNHDSQLGATSSDTCSPGDLPCSHTPIQVTCASPSACGGTGNWSQIAAGLDMNLALTDTGELWGWGNFIYGNNPVVYTQPTRIGTASNWTSIDIGKDGWSMAGIRADGTLWTWGDGGSGQLGHGNSTSHSLPVQVLLSDVLYDPAVYDDDDWVEVAVGSYHMVAMKADHSLWTWGANWFGQLGTDASDDVFYPVQVEPGRKFSFIGAGAWTTFARARDGSTWAAGQNGQGQLSDGGTVDVYALKRVQLPWALVEAVNSVGDLPDEDPDDGLCDTGKNVRRGLTECTLRAAIDHANATPGQDTIRFDWTDRRHIETGPELPGITESVAIEGGPWSNGRPSVVLDGSNADADAAGLVITGDDVTVQVSGLEITSYPGSGVLSSATDPELSFVDVRFTHNCGWGLEADYGRILLGAAKSDHKSEIYRNGHGAGCDAGGVFVEDTDSFLQIRDASLNGNGGAGVLTGGTTEVSNVLVAENDGPGVAVVASSDGGQSTDVRLDVFLLDDQDDNRIERNQGMGLYAEYGGISISGPVEIKDNAGWGVYAVDGLVSIGKTNHLLGSRRTIRSNGHGKRCRQWWIDDFPTASDEDCAGGGVFAGGTDKARFNTLYEVQLLGNDGPGFMGTAEVVLGDIDIRNNAGPGINVTVEANDAFSGTAVSLTELPGNNLIADNQGDGVYARDGDVVLDGAVEVRGNGRWGVAAITGAVSVGGEGALAGIAHTVRENGDGPFCAEWNNDGSAPARVEVSCEGGGILIETQGLTAYDIEVTGNTGVGVRAGEDVSITHGRVCENSVTDVDADGELTLDDAEVCKTPPKPSKDQRGCKGGCTTAPGATPALPWLLLILAARRRIAIEHEMGSPPTKDGGQAGG